MIKTKTEFAALLEFLIWLEGKKLLSNGIILVFHESKKFLPLLLLKALQRYNLVERFQQTVKGFANTYSIYSKRSNHLKSLELGDLSISIFNKTQDLSTATKRARLIWDISQNLGES